MDLFSNSLRFIIWRGGILDEKYAKLVRHPSFVNIDLTMFYLRKILKMDNTLNIFFRIVHSIIINF